MVLLFVAAVRLAEKNSFELVLLVFRECLLARNLLIRPRRPFSAFGGVGVIGAWLLKLLLLLDAIGAGSGNGWPLLLLSFASLLSVLKDCRRSFRRRFSSSLRRFSSSFLIAIEFAFLLSAYGVLDRKVFKIIYSSEAQGRKEKNEREKKTL